MANAPRGAPGTLAVAVPVAAAAASKEGVPNQTLYLRNLPDKLPKEDLKRNLYMLFATYGVILDIMAFKTMKMRGQAHIVFRDLDAATQAMRALQSFTFFGKDMQIAYARSKSNTVAKLKGAYSAPTIEASGDADQPSTLSVGFGTAPEKAVPINAESVAKGQKRGREDEDEEEEEEDDVEMEMDVSDEDSD